MREDLVRMSGATVVVRSFQGGGDVQNAFAVLAGVIGTDAALTQVRAEAARLGEDADAIINAVWEEGA